MSPLSSVMARYGTAAAILACACTDVSPDSSLGPGASAATVDAGAPQTPGESTAADAGAANSGPDAGVDVFTASISASGLGIPIPDDGYLGAAVGSACIDAYLTANDPILGVRIEIAIEHPAAGDLTLQIRSPAGTTATLFNRPGAFEASDDGGDLLGAAANLSALYPIVLTADAFQSAELIGSGLGDSDTVCLSDGVCEFLPNSGSVSGAGLSDVLGEGSTGTWRICLGDSNPGQTGTFEGFALELDVPSLF